ncbi:hypothetical protein ACJX0J_041502, partial [Zea mays]
FKPIHNFAKSNRREKQLSIQTTQFLIQKKRKTWQEIHYSRRKTHARSEVAKQEIHYLGHKSHVVKHNKIGWEDKSKTYVLESEYLLKH